MSRVNEGVRGAPLPGANAPTVYDVVAPGMGERLDVIVLGDFIVGLMAHWVKDGAGNGSSVSCDEWRGTCKICGPGVRVQWLGFCPVYLFRGHTRAILRVGPETSRRMLACTRPVLGLRGHSWQLGRGEDQRTGSLALDPCPFSAPHPLPQPCAMRHTLMTVLRTDALPDWDCAEPEDVPLPREGGGAS